ncbi:ADP-ribosylglycohydrolase family protein [Candidatus Dependentiae bacterium]
MGTLFGLCVGDAVGFPNEGSNNDNENKQSLRSTLTDMQPGYHKGWRSDQSYNKAGGCFTDDGSMALCLAHSLLACKGDFCAKDIMNRFCLWGKRNLNFGYNSSEQHSFGFGGQCLDSMDRFAKKKQPFADDFQQPFAADFQRQKKENS